MPCDLPQFMFEAPMLPCTGIPLITTFKNLFAAARHSNNLMGLEAGWPTAVGEEGSNDLRYLSHHAGARRQAQDN